MPATCQDTLNVRRTLIVGSKEYDYFSLRAASEVNLYALKAKRHKTEKEELINQPRVSFWIDKIDGLLEENEESELSFDEFDLKTLTRETRKSMRKSIAVMDVV